MRALIAIVSCHTRPEFSDAQRKTWIPKIPPGVDYKFFLGRGPNRPKEDEVLLDCDDSYQGLPSKVQSIFKWTQEQGYDFGMKLDDDTILKPEEWYKSGFELYDYTGNTAMDARTKLVTVPYGFAYVLSRKSMEVIINSPLPKDNNDEEWVALSLHKRDISLHIDARYFLHTGKRAEAKRGPENRPLREFNRPPEREPVHGTFAWCIYINWLGWHTTPTDELLKEYYRVWEKTCLC